LLAAVEIVADNSKTPARLDASGQTTCGEVRRQKYEGTVASAVPSRVTQPLRRDSVRFLPHRCRVMAEDHRCWLDRGGQTALL